MSFVDLCPDVLKIIVGELVHTDFISLKLTCKRMYLLDNEYVEKWLVCYQGVKLHTSTQYLWYTRYYKPPRYDSPEIYYTTPTHYYSTNFDLFKIALTCYAKNRKDCINKFMSLEDNWLIRHYAYYYWNFNEAIRKFLFARSILPRRIQNMLSESTKFARLNPFSVLSKLQYHKIICVPYTRKGIEFANKFYEKSSFVYGNLYQ